MQLQPQPQHPPASPPEPPTVRVPIAAVPFCPVRASRLCVGSISVRDVFILAFSREARSVHRAVSAKQGTSETGSDTLGLPEGVLANKLSFRKGQGQAQQECWGVRVLWTVGGARAADSTPNGEGTCKMAWAWAWGGKSLREKKPP